MLSLTTKWRPKFSMRTLLLLAIVAGCGLMLWRNWAPWRLEREVVTGIPAKANFEGRYSLDMRWMMLDVNLPESQLEELSIWDLKNSTKVLALKPDRVLNYNMSHNGTMAAVLVQRVINETVLQLWDLRTQRLISARSVRAGYFVDDPTFSAEDGSVHLNGSLFDTKDNLKELQLNTHVQNLSKREETKVYPAALLQSAREAKLLYEYANLAHGLPLKTKASPCGRWLLTALPDSGTQVWNWETGQKVSDSDIELFSSPNNQVQFSGSERVAVIHRRGNDLMKGVERISIVDLMSGKVVGKMEGKFDYGFAHHFTSDGNTLLAGPEGGRFWYWQYQKDFRSFAYGRDVVTVSSDATLVVDAAPEILEYINANISQWLLEGRYLATKNFRMLDVRTGETIATMRHESRLSSCRFSCDGQSLYSLTRNSILTWHRYRPERWWGVVWLLEFWMLMLAAGALGWSIWRDRSFFRQTSHA